MDDHNPGWGFLHRDLVHSAGGKDRHFILRQSFLFRPVPPLQSDRTLRDDDDLVMLMPLCLKGYLDRAVAIYMNTSPVQAAPTTAPAVNAPLNPVRITIGANRMGDRNCPMKPKVPR
jgi:hypothetical protein